MAIKKVLVTGSNGLLGQKLMDIIRRQKDIKLIATSKGPDRYPEKAGYVYYMLDLSDQEALSRIIREHRPDLVFHTAAISSVDACEADPQGCMALNVAATKHIAELCAELQAHLIHLSTDFIFDGQAGPYAEDDAANPISVYGTSKLRSERAIKESGCRWTIIRTILVYGWVEGRSTIVSWVIQNLSAGLPIRVPGDQVRMPTLAEDLAEACWLAGRDGHHGTFHISGKESMSIAELAGRTADFFNLDKSLITVVSAEQVPNAALRPLRTGFILTRAAGQINYHPRSLEEGLKIYASQSERVNGR